MTEVKPCRYCGSSKIRIEEFEAYQRVLCCTCGLGTSWQESTEEAIRAWNDRGEEEIKADTNPCDEEMAEKYRLVITTVDGTVYSFRVDEIIHDHIEDAMQFYEHFISVKEENRYYVFNLANVACIQWEELV